PKKEQQQYSDQAQAQTRNVQLSGQDGRGQLMFRVVRILLHDPLQKIDVALKAARSLSRPEVFVQSSIPAIYARPPPKKRIGSRPSRAKATSSVSVSMDRRRPFTTVRGPRAMSKR